MRFDAAIRSRPHNCPRFRICFRQRLPQLVRRCFFHGCQSVKSKVKLCKEFIKLPTIPGVGDILGLTIMLEVGGINRFAKVGNYCSYCRCVESKRLSNGKKKGENNKKNGNKYLAWAYVEAANFAARYCPRAQ